MEVIDGFDVGDYHVNAGVDVLVPSIGGIGDHQVTVDGDIGAEEVANRANQGWPESDGAINDPIAVHHVHVNPFNACCDCFLEGLAESREVSSEVYWA